MSNVADDRIADLIDHARDCRECEPYERPMLELQRLRATVKRLEEFALSLEHAHHPDMRTVGDMLRRRMRAP